jgi:hypothetical protein
VDDGDERVQLDGGPMDGQEFDVAPGTDEITVGMSDRSRHRYRRHGLHPSARDGRPAVVFRWAGRDEDR